MAWIIDFFPLAGAAPLTYEVTGDVLAVNGEPYDFGFLGEGDSYPAEAVPGGETWLRSTEVTRWQGALRLCVVMPFDPEAVLPTHVRHPGPVTVEAGPVPLPTDEVTDAAA
jgi:hypothetical protein